LFIAEEFIVLGEDVEEEVEAKAVVENVKIQIAANEPENKSIAIHIGRKAAIRWSCVLLLKRISLKVINGNMIVFNVIKIFYNNYVCKLHIVNDQECL
jgi:hypothetical protein